MKKNKSNQININYFSTNSSDRFMSCIKSMSHKIVDFDDNTTTTQTNLKEKQTTTTKIWKYLQQQQQKKKNHKHTLSILNIIKLTKFNI